jgi:hypothetical protein
MAKTLRKPRTPSTTLAALEKLFGPVLPGKDAPDKTISVFQEFTSTKKYKLVGKLGILEGAIWHLHTVIPIVPAKVKGFISGILEEGKQHDPQRQKLAANWLTEHNRAASRIGEFDASLSIDSLGETIAIRVKIDAKGKIKILVPKGKSLQLG